MRANCIAFCGHGDFQRSTMKIDICFSFYPKQTFELEHFNFQVCKGFKVLSQQVFRGSYMLLLIQESYQKVIGGFYMLIQE